MDRVQPSKLNAALWALRPGLRQWGLSWGLLFVFALALFPANLKLGGGWAAAHTVLELVSVAVGAMVFMTGRNTLMRQGSLAAALVGTMFLFAAIMDTAHFMAFPGMPDWLTPNGEAKAIAYWLLARLAVAGALWLCVSQDWTRDGSREQDGALLTWVLVLLTGTAVVLVVVVAWLTEAHPQLWWADAGLTSTKILAEYLVIALMLGVLIKEALRTGNSAPYSREQMISALLTLIVAEWCFTGYQTTHDGYIVLGHVYKALGYLLLFRALGAGLIREPYLRLQQAEAEAQRKEDELQAIFQATPDAVALINEAGVVQKINSRFTEILGYEAGEVSGLSIDVLVPQRYRADHWRHVHEYMRVPKVRAMGTGRELFARRRDGTELPIDVSLSPLVLGKEKFVIVSLRDNTERARMLNDVRASELRLRSFLDNSVDWVWETNPTGIITYSSQSVADVLGYSAEEATGRNLLSFMTEAEAMQLSAQIQQIMVRREPLRNIEFACTTQAGRVCLVQTNARPFFEADGHFLGYRGVTRDITRQRQLQADLEKSESTFRRAFDDFPIGMAFVDCRGGLNRVNAYLCDLLGYPKAAMSGISLFRLFPVEQHRDISRDILALCQGWSDHYSAEVRMLCQNGEIRWVRLDAVLVDSSNEESRLLMLMVQDMTAERETKSHNLRLLSIIERMGDTVAVADRTGRNLYLNPYGRTMLGIGLEEDIAHETIANHHSPAVASFLQQRALPMAEEHGVWEGETAWLSRSGEEIATWQVIMVHKDAGGEVEYWTTVARDIRERKRWEERLSHQATHDALTGLPNRLLFRDRLQQAVAVAARERKLMAVVFVDLDNFKRINDTLGHAHGDTVLQESAHRLRECLRASDTLARQGGDEFIALLPGLATVGDAERIVKKIINALVRPIAVAKRDIHVTASVGVSVYPFDHDNAEELLRKADVAMYRAKEQGRNAYAFYTSDMDERLHQALQTEVELRHAIASDELFLHYQPKVSLHTGELIGFEALVRWRHPVRGIVPPAEFIPVAERSVLINQLGEWVMREACRQIRRWLDEGAAPLPVSVNLSAHQFEGVDVTQLVSTTLAQFRVDGRLLELEITEGVLMRDPTATTRALNQIKTLGVKISVDDFGTGHSSLGYLKQFPVDVLKIDRSFIENVCANDDDASIVRAIVSMAQNLGVQVVAEGVETQAQLDFLRQCGCDCVQGYFYSKPLPADDAIRFVPPAQA